MRAVLVCVLLSAVAISADLQADIDEVKSHMPLTEIESIVRQYVSTYPSTADGLRYVQNVTYEKVVKDFVQSEDGQKLIDYFNHRGIDIESILISEIKPNSEILDKWLEPIKENEILEPAITGDFKADYNKVMAESSFYEAVDKKMEESPEFANFVAALKDPELRDLFYRASNSKDLEDGKNPQVRGFLKKAWKVTQAAVVASLILG